MDVFSEAYDSNLRKGDKGTLRKASLALDVKECGMFSGNSDSMSWNQASCDVIGNGPGEGSRASAAAHALLGRHGTPSGGNRKWLLMNDLTTSELAGSEELSLARKRCAARRHKNHHHQEGGRTDGASCLGAGLLAHTLTLVPLLAQVFEANWLACGQSVSMPPEPSGAVLRWWSGWL